MNPYDTPEGREALEKALGKDRAEELIDALKIGNASINDADAEIRESLEKAAELFGVEKGCDRRWYASWTERDSVPRNQNWPWRKISAATYSEVLITARLAVPVKGGEMINWTRVWQEADRYHPDNSGLIKPLAWRVYRRQIQEAIEQQFAEREEITYDTLKLRLVDAQRRLWRLIDLLKRDEILREIGEEEK